MAEPEPTDPASPPDGPGMPAGARGDRDAGRRGGRQPRQFFSIGEVCELLELKPHVLRYWETVFPELSPTKNRAGNRVYRARDLDLIATIQQMLQVEKYTVEGAREQLRRSRPGAAAGAAAGPAGLDASRLRALRRELSRIAELLALPDGR